MVPHAMRQRVHYYHTGVNETDWEHASVPPATHAAKGKGGRRGPFGPGQRLNRDAPPTSFLKLLRETAIEDDFVGACSHRLVPSMTSPGVLRGASVSLTRCPCRVPSVVKVDIDGGPELPVVHAIANDPTLMKLVDELYFEYHFYFDGIDFGWGAMDPQNTADDALALMQKLRKGGVRAHFWI